MQQKKTSTRRNFLKTGAVVAGGFFIVPRHVLGRGYTAPSDKLNVAAIGAGGKGSGDIANAWNNGANNVVALCDVDTAQCKGSLEKFPNAKFYKDFRVMLEEMKGSRKKLKQVLKSLEAEYDFVFIDCPPGFSALSENIFTAADVVLMPVIPTTLSIRTYQMVKDYFKEKDIDQQKMMCFFTMADMRKNLHHEIMNELYKDKKFFQNYIPYLSDVEKMGIHKAPVMEFANSSYAAKSYRELWTEIKEGLLD